MGQIIQNSVFVAETTCCITSENLSTSTEFKSKRFKGDMYLKKYTESKMANLGSTMHPPFSIGEFANQSRHSFSP